ncbi:MAG: C4-dicarboxylate ABC transporter substrate-binding protein [Deltaproteobacteria bacterium HGW-Deltaproteobacteria-15]|nr:MAG: C4-dicarboxylate ABC transporter substrate-binding protein [Deltaproteobacteria bacterium HGW-Deltaproteobacteria-15]
MKKIAIGFIVLFATLAMVWGGAAGAADYPTKRLTYVICFNPGGESDITARFQEQPLKKYFGQDVIITYKIGGGGALGWSELVQSKPDGYTIAGHNLPHTILQPMEMSNAGYKTLDLKQIYFFQQTPDVLMVRNDSPFKTLKDFIDYAKSQPAGVVTVGGSATSSANDLGTAMLSKVAGVKLTYVPFAGTGSAVPALLGGHVTALMSYSPMVVQYKEKFRFLAMASEQRMEVIPDVPTFRELGYDVVEGAYRGVAAPPGTPDNIIKYLAEAFDKTMKDPEVRKKMDQNGFKTEFLGPEASTALVKKKMVEYEAIMKELGRLKK